ncbi:NAD(P)-dependent alcohol dehydrogenase [Hymenobacter crusticola]|uniref:Zinc-binding alcohol dehydrogenase n=1 Tax=Hymenobacter crusticola TaxID=1770526 RepID=A0A243W7F5_9BACT|nr:NAD(P)-dependent alcohol dehydrogenase [Hymenobacter crusticola]OUJ70905.1 zinc-binding alcohol dehydrogenase [Hymenobacter crusticola]
MKAIYYEGYGEPDVLRYGDQPDPDLKPDYILVRVRASSVNPVDWKIRQGHLLPVSGLSFPKIPGRDMAGDVVSIGPEVTRFQVGDRVFAMLNDGLGGANAELASVSEKVAAPIPANLDYQQAAAVPLAAYTALQALRDKGELQPGEKVLINGASSGVGSFAVQIAKVLGASEVTAVVGPDNVALAKELGADQVINYKEHDFTADKDRYDLIFDAVATNSYSASKDSLREKGRYVTTVPNPKDVVSGPISVFTDKKMKPVWAEANGIDLALLGEWLEAGKVKPLIDRTFPLAETAEAHRYSEEGHAVGKIVLVVE